MKIICIKLTTGEDIIAKATESPLSSVGINLDDLLQEGQPLKSLAVVLTDTRVVGFHPLGKGLAIMPWTLGNQDVKLSVDLKDIAIAVYAPDPELEKIYMQQTTSIALASPSQMPGGANLKLAK